MNLKQERLLDIRDQKKKSLDNEVTETLTTQVSTRALWLLKFADSAF